jgi:hypothetical protein
MCNYRYCGTRAGLLDVLINCLKKCLIDSYSSFRSADMLIVHNFFSVESIVVLTDNLKQLCAVLNAAVDSIITITVIIFFADGLALLNFKLRRSISC